MLSNSVHALTRAIISELDKEGESLLHGIIRLSCAMAFLTNGVKSCTVQVECKAGCGYMVEAFGEEAETLRRKAIAIQSILEQEVTEGSKRANAEFLS